MTPNKNRVNKSILNPKIKPDLLRNNEWQALLRKQFAHIQKLKVTNVGSEQFYSEFDIFNPQTKNKYKVAIRSINEPKNFCTCFDFKTNKLGTCKHIEAVFFHLESLPNFEVLASKIPDRKYSSIYVDYLHHRKIKIRIGIENTNEIKNITKNIFDENGFLIEENVLEFKTTLNSIQNKFSITIYDDAHELIDSTIEHQQRIKTINGLDDTEINTNTTTYKLRSHQLNTAYFILRNAKVIVSAELGTGAGISCLAAVSLARKYLAVSKILIVSEKINYWNNKVDAFLNEKIIHVIGNEHSRKKIYEITTTQIKIVSTNDAASDLKFINQIGYDFVIFDNASVFDNLNNDLCKQLKKIKSKFTLLLTHLDLINNLEAFYSQIQAIDMYLPGSVFNFTNRYAIKNAHGKIVAVKNKEELMIHLNNHYLRNDFKDIVNSLESPISKNVMVTLSTQHQNFYDDYLNNATISFETQNGEQKKKVISNLLQLSTSSYLFNKTNLESKLSILLQILRGLNSNEYNILIVTSWPEYKHVLEAYLQHNDYVINDENKQLISIKTIDEIEQENTQNINIVICSDVNCGLKVSGSLTNKVYLKYVLIASDTLEESYYLNNPKSENEVFEIASQHIIKKTKLEKRILDKITNQNTQLSFLGDDDIEENNDSEVAETIELFNQLESKLNRIEIRQSLMKHSKIPERLRELNKFYES